MSNVLPSEALLSGVSQGRLEVVQKALVEGADPEFSRTELTALVMAAERGDADIVQALLDGGASPNRGNRARWSPLHAAARSGREDVIRVLVPAMLLPNTRDNDGDTALHAAVAANQAGAVQVLLDMGLDANLANHAGYTPFSLAVDRRLEDIAGILARCGGNWDYATNIPGCKTARELAVGWDEAPSTTAPSVGPARPVVEAAPSEATAIEATADAEETLTPRPAVSTIRKRTAS